MVDAVTSDKWESHVFTLMGHGMALRHEDRTDMGAYCFRLAADIARFHLDGKAADRVRAVAVAYGIPAPRAGEEG